MTQEGTVSQLDLVDSDWGSLGFQLLPFPGSFVIPTLVLFHSFLVAENIYSKTGIEKTVQSVCC